MLTCFCAAATVMLNFCVAVSAVGVVESVAFTVKPKVPGAVGVPEIAPVEAFKFRPGGREEEVIDHVYGVVPPVAARLSLYARPCWPLANKVVVTLTGVAAAATVMLSGCVAVSAAGVLASVTIAVKLNDPAVVGVPEIVPLATANVKPAGSVPALTLQLYGAVPPLAVNVAEYAFSAVPPGKEPDKICTAAVEMC